MSTTEQEMVTKGTERYLRAVASASSRSEPSSSPGGTRNVMAVVTRHLVKAVGRELRAKGPGRQVAARPYLRQIKAKRAAFIAARTVFDLLPQIPTATKVCVAIGSKIEDEVRFSLLRKASPGLYMKTTKWLRGTQNYSIKRRRYIQAERGSDKVDAWKEWPLRDRLLVGAWFVERLLEAGVIEKHMPSDGRRKRLHLIPSAKTVAEIQAGNSRALTLSPWYMPITEEPADWRGPVGGGYHDPLSRTRLVKSGAWETGHIDFEASDLSTTLRAINAMQRTPWQINRDVLEVVRYMWENSVDRAGLAPLTPTPKPTRPDWLTEDTDTRTLTGPLRAEFKAWKRAMSDAKRIEVERGAKIVATRLLMDVATRFEKEERLYLPYQLDWRGRVYPLPLFTSPQGRDVERAILRFADGKPVGGAGGEWLAIHGANCWGLDKVPFDQRVAWVLDNEEMLRSIYADPLDDWRWADADSPFMFLAFVLEWVPFLDSGCSEDFVSHLPVSMDGSCNGLQHFSAMLRDRRGGRSVNLVPGLPPQDVYGEVADAVRQRVLDLPAEEIRNEWIEHGIARTDVKRQVMTTPYGVTRIGMAWQLTHHLQQERAFGSAAHRAAEWLTPHVEAAIGEVVQSSRQAMLYLHYLAQLTTKAGVPLRWTTPHGLVIEQRYEQTRAYLVKTKLMGTVQLTLRTRIPKLDKRKQVSSVSPNVVHSFDAAHLMRTIEWMEDLGGACYSMAHDSFGCHAGDAPLMAEVLRVTFIEQYRDDVLDWIRSEIQPSLPEGTAMPELPPLGDLDLQGILRAEFFFA